jgi:predicted metal-binding membrane protein
MFGAGMSNAAWMLIVGGLMAAERSDWRPRRGSVPGWIGAALIASAVATVWASWL